MLSVHRTLPLVGAALVVVAACSSPPIPDGWEELGPRLGGHLGPPVDAGTTGTARFVEPLLGLFEARAAMALARDVDRAPRPPASEGYDRAVDRVLSELYGAGFGEVGRGGDVGFALQVLSEPMAQPAWTPVSAELAVTGSDPGGRRQRVVVAGFSDPSDAQRTMLPRGVASFSVKGAPVFSMGAVKPGTVLVTDRSVREVCEEAEERGAAAVVSTFLLPYAVDPTGRDRHFDAVFDGSVKPGSDLPCLYVSPRTGENVRQAAKRGALVELRGEVRTRAAELRTVVATIEGAERPDEVVYVVAHVSGSGAGDNAAGVAGMVEVARTIKRLITAGSLERPRRSIRFVFGKESEAGATVLERMGDTPIAGIVADMIAASYSATGAICLLERGWDPAAVLPLPPDQHTPWGAGSVAEEDVLPSGLAIVLREALVDVGEATLARGAVAWSTREHPWEGGSDHDAFLDRGIAAALVWHFTDFSYSTSLDRMDHVDEDELRRTSVAIGAAALAVADLSSKDLQRHLDTLNLEARVRMDAARAAEENSEWLQQAWKQWFDGARFWLKALAAGEELPDMDPLRPVPER